MALRKKLRMVAFLVLLSAASASADFEEMLVEYAALDHDLGLVTGFVKAYQGIRISEPANLRRSFKDVSSSAQIWSAITQFQDSFFVVAGLRDKTRESLSEFHNTKVKNRVKEVLKSLDGVEDMFGTESAKVWLIRRDAIMDKFQGVKSQLEGIEKWLRKKVEDRGSKIGGFLEIALAMDPNYFSLQQLEQLESLKQTLAQLDAERGRLTVLRKVKSTLEHEVEACRSDCAAQKATLQKLNVKLGAAWEDTLEASIKKLRRRLEEKRSQEDERIIKGLERLPPELRLTIQKNVISVFDEAVGAAFANGRTEGSVLNFVVQVTDCKNVAFKKNNPKVSLSVFLSAQGVRCPVMRAFKASFEAIPALIAGFLKEELRGIILSAEQHYQTELGFVAEAGAQARQLCDSRRASAMTHPPFNPASVNQPLYEAAYALAAPLLPAYGAGDVYTPPPWPNAPPQQ